MAKSGVCKTQRGFFWTLPVNSQVHSHTCLDGAFRIIFMPSEKTHNMVDGNEKRLPLLKRPDLEMSTQKRHAVIIMMVKIS